MHLIIPRRCLASKYSTSSAATSLSSSPQIVHNLNFVPKHQPPTLQDVQKLQNFVEEHSRIFVVTGAGVSTESGIPDYRSEDVGLFATSNQRPMKIQEFLSSPAAQKRYWARNFFAWPRFSSFRPNVTHKTVRDWELSGKVSCLITQNVDGLHIKAGSRDCIELHGSNHRVICVSKGCDYTIERRLFQNVLLDLNPNLRVMTTSSSSGSAVNQIRPDGDITIDENIQKTFVIPPCPSCGGILKPDIVFFGDNVSKSKVDLIYDHLHSSDSILVLGSSLQTFSAFRYLMSGSQLEKRIAIVTLGPTRADGLAQLKLICRVGELLPLVKL